MLDRRMCDTAWEMEGAFYKTTVGGV
jgi:hypothetical protein